MHITYPKGKVLNDGRYIVDRQLNSKFSVVEHQPLHSFILCNA